MALLFLQTASTVAMAADLSIKLKDNAGISTRVYLLADVATVQGEASVAKRMARVELGRAPRPGHWAKLTRHEIAARLERDMPGVGRRISWSGPSTVRIAAVAVAYPGSRIGEFAMDTLRSELGARFERVEIEPTSEPEDLLVPAGRVDLRATGLKDLVPAKRQVVWVDISVNDDHYQTLPVWFGVTIEADVVVAARDLARHSIVASNDLQVARLDIATVKGTPVMDPNELIGLRLLKPIAAGQVLVNRVAEPAPAIQEGQLIEVVARSGRVILRSKAIALGDGDLHERIAVRNPSSGERYFATVTGPGHVHVN